jgi:hypothetical protein
LLDCLTWSLTASSLAGEGRWLSGLRQNKARTAFCAHADGDLMGEFYSFPSIIASI